MNYKKAGAMKRLIIPIIVMLIISFAGAEVQSPEEPPDTLTLEESIGRALRANLALSAAREDYNQSRYSLLGAWSNFLPTASTRFSWSKSGDETYSLGETGVNVSDEHYSTGFSASQTLFSGGKSYLELRRSIHSRNAAQRDFADRRAEVVLMIKEAYYAAIGAEQSAENARDALERTSDQMELVAQRDSLGMADPTEVSQMKVRLLETELTALQADNAQDRALENLMSLLSYPFTAQVELVDPGEEVPGGNSLEFYLSRIDESSAVKSAELAVRRAKLSEYYSWAGYLPGVSASYGYNWSGVELPEDLGALDEESSWSVGISANWTLFSGTSRISSIKSSSSAYRAAQINLESVRRNLESNIRNKYRTLKEAEVRLRLADVRLEDAALNSSLFREKYELGDCTLLELLQAELSLREAEAEVVSARFDYNIAAAELARYIQ